MAGGNGTSPAPEATGESGPQPQTSDCSPGPTDILSSVVTSAMARHPAGEEGESTLVLPAVPPQNSFYLYASDSEVGDQAADLLAGNEEANPAASASASIHVIGLAEASPEQMEDGESHYGGYGPSLSELQAAEAASEIGGSTLGLRQ